MRKLVQIEQVTCDICKGDTHASYACLACHKDLCYKCGIQYQHAVYFSGSGDGYYCPECVQRLLVNPTPLFSAYDKIQKLRTEREAFDKDFRLRSDKAAERVKQLRAELNLN